MWVGVVVRVRGKGVNRGKDCTPFYKVGYVAYAGKSGNCEFHARVWYARVLWKRRRVLI